MISPYEFIILGLASGRVAYCIATEDIFLPLRERLTERDQLNDGGPYDGEGFLLSVFTCPWCLSAWTSLLAMIAWWVAGDHAVTAALPFALWGTATLFIAKGYHS